MSYILDALRKSGQQRQQGQAPRLADAPLPVAIAPGASRKLTRLVAGILSVAVLGLGVVIGSLRPWETPTPAATTAPAVEPQAPAAPAPVDEPAPAPATEPPPQAAAATDVAPEAPAMLPATETDAAPPPMPVIAATPEVAPPPKLPVSSTPPPPLAAKPAAPSITLTVHAYSDTPSERIARINGKFVHEGDEIEAGLKLERITKDGVVLNFRGQRLHRNLR